jgi:CRISPR-associated protein Cmr1
MARFAKREYQLELVTPAFLGGADQSAQWRTAGIKALIRQWWRVVWTAENPNKTVNDMRAAEAVRFGSVQDGLNQKAQIQIRFDEEPKNTASQVQGIQRDQNQSLQYLGFGPFVQPTRPSSKTALNSGTKVKFKILIQSLDEQQTQQFSNEIDQTMFLVHQFGALGSRSNNAWGILNITGDIQPQDLKTYSQTLAQCLQSDWKKAIAKDQQGLMVWQTPPLQNADDVMKRLKTFRKDGHNYIAKQQGQRPLVNAPVKGNQNRNPSQYVLKVLKDGTQYRGQVSLLAHKWCNDGQDLTRVLTSIATGLDNDHSFNRIAG